MTDVQRQLDTVRCIFIRAENRTHAGDRRLGVQLRLRRGWLLHIGTRPEGCLIGGRVVECRDRKRILRHRCLPGGGLIGSIGLRRRRRPCAHLGEGLMCRKIDRLHIDTGPTCTQLLLPGETTLLPVETCRLRHLREVLPRTITGVRSGTCGMLRDDTCERLSGGIDEAHEAGHDENQGRADRAGDRVQHHREGTTDDTAADAELRAFTVKVHQSHVLHTTRGKQLEKRRQEHQHKQRRAHPERRMRIIDVREDEGHHEAQHDRKEIADHAEKSELHSLQCCADRTTETQIRQKQKKRDGEGDDDRGLVPHQGCIILLCLTAGARPGICCRLRFILAALRSTHITSPGRNI